MKIILPELTSILSLPATAKTQYLVYISFNSTLQLINSISSDCQKLLRYFNGIESPALFIIPSLLFGPGWATVFGNDLVLKSKYYHYHYMQCEHQNNLLQVLNKTLNYLLYQNNMNFILSNCILAWPNLSLQNNLLLFHQFLWCT